MVDIQPAEAEIKKKKDRRKKIERNYGAKI